MNFFFKRYWGVGILIALALCVAVFWFFNTGSSTRVIILGFDGLDEIILRRLIEDGDLPAFSKIYGEGASGTLMSVHPMISPLVWTSIMTGVDAESHGVYNFFEVVDDAKGKPRVRPATSEGRRAPALWNIASHHGIKVGAIGWFASWPAERVKGFVLSNEWLAQRKDPPRGIAYPPGFEREISEILMEPSPTEAESVIFKTSLFGLSEAGREKAKIFQSIYRASELTRQSAKYLLSRRKPQLLMAYFALPDAGCHLFSDYSHPQLAGLPPEDVRIFSSTVDNIYKYIDGIVREVLQFVDENTVLVICSDHGFKSGAAKPTASAQVEQGHAVDWHRMEGVLLIYGKNIIPGAVIHDADVYDVAPTVLSVLSVPISAELRGKILSDIFQEKKETKTVSSYKDIRRTPIAPVSQPDVSELRETLRALGYIGAGGKQSEAEERDIALTYVNMGIVKIQNNKWEEGKDLFSKALRIYPRYPLAMYFSAVVEARQGRLQAAIQKLDETLSLDETMTIAYLEKARIEQRLGDIDSAINTLERARKIAPQSADILHRLALSYMGKERGKDAEETLKTALLYAESNEQKALFYNLLGAIIQRDEDRLLEAEDMFIAATEHFPHWAEAWLGLGLLYTKMHDNAGALSALEKAEAIRSSDHTLLNLIGKIYIDMRNREKAMDYLERSLEIFPDQPETARILAQLKSMQ